VAFMLDVGPSAAVSTNSTRWVCVMVVWCGWKNHFAAPVVVISLSSSAPDDCAASRPSTRSPARGTSRLSADTVCEVPERVHGSPTTMSSSSPTSRSTMADQVTPVAEVRVKSIFPTDRSASVIRCARTCRVRLSSTIGSPTCTHPAGTLTRIVELMTKHMSRTTSPTARPVANGTSRMLASPPERPTRYPILVGLRYSGIDHAQHGDLVDAHLGADALAVILPHEDGHGPGALKVHRGVGGVLLPGGGLLGAVQPDAGLDARGARVDLGGAHPEPDLVAQRPRGDDAAGGRLQIALGGALLQREVHLQRPGRARAAQGDVGAVLDVRSERTARGHGDDAVADRAGLLADDADHLDGLLAVGRRADVAAARAGGRSLPDRRAGADAPVRGDVDQAVGAATGGVADAACGHGALEVVLEVDDRDRGRGAAAGGAQDDRPLRQPGRGVVEVEHREPDAEALGERGVRGALGGGDQLADLVVVRTPTLDRELNVSVLDRKSTRLNSSHVKTSYAVFCLTKKT